MKTTIKTLVMLLVVFASMTVKASDELNLSVSEEQFLIVQLQPSENGSMISLEDANGTVLYHDSFIDSEKFQKAIGFQKLKDGFYYLKFDKEYEIRVSTIKKENGKVSIDNSKYAVIFKPFFKQEGSLVKVFFNNPTETKSVTRVFDEKGVEVGEFKCANMIVKRNIDFSQVPDGNYLVEVTVGNHTFRKQIKLG